MKKNFFYVALGLMGMMGISSLGIANAEGTTCWEGKGTLPTTTVASGIVYGCDGSIPIITIYGDDGKGITIKAMNEGTGTVIGTGEDSYGSHYQWGNNHGFSQSLTKTSNSELFTKTIATYNSYGPSNPYNNSIFRRGSTMYDYWGIYIHYDNLWGGSGDDGPENDGIYNGAFWGFNTGDFTVTNSLDRRGMCDTGYHIPSAGERDALLHLWATNSNYNGTSLNSLKSLYEISAGTNFSQDLLIPFAGLRNYENGEVSNTGSDAYYWSSSPVDYDYGAHFFYFNADKLEANNDDGRGMGYTVRCFKNSYVESPQTLTFFTVTVDVSPAEGGSASSGSIEAVSGSSITGTIEAGTGFIKSGDLVLSTVTPNPGYIFSGWTTDCGETLTANCTFTGEFKEILYEVEFTGNNVSTGKVEVISDSVVNLTGNEIASSDTKDGYVFIGWNTDSGANEGLSNITVTGNIILYSIFQPITYTVSYDANEGTGTMTDSGYTYDLSGNLAENTFTKTGYVFSGWKYNDEIYTGNQEIKNLTGINGATITMVTQWKPIKYTVKFEAGEGTGTMENQNFEYDSGQALTANAFTKTGYTFSGWTYGTTGYADKQNVSNLTTTDGATLTLTAQWTPIIYTISFSGNAADATGTAPATINAQYSGVYTAPDNSFTRTGYTFTGWNTESAGSGTGYTTGATLKNLTTTGGDVVTLYAQWKANTYIVTFDVNGGNALTPNTGSVTYDAAYGTLPTPSRNGYSFNGWFTAATNGTKVTASTIVSATGDHTLYAQWTQNQPSGGSSGGSSGGGGGSKAKTSNDSTKSTDSQTGSKVDSSTNISGNEENTQNSSAKASEGQNQGKTYSDEFQQAYEFAYKHGITTMPTIEQANMEGPLTRIAMAKMLSYYAINVLGLKPDETRVNKFNDVSDQMDAEYNNAVSLAYQLGIMGINMPKNNFRPNDLVTRAEFATALSRMLYKIADGKDVYYSTHLAKLMEEKIITNDNPDLQELRGYVMIMLMRSANKS